MANIDAGVNRRAFWGERGTQTVEQNWMKRFGTERLTDADTVGCIAVEQGREGPMATLFAYESVTPPTGPTLWISCPESRTAQG